MYGSVEEAPMRMYVSERINLCTEGKRERESERWSRGWGRQGCRGKAERRADIDSRGICARSTRLRSKMYVRSF